MRLLALLLCACTFKAELPPAFRVAGRVRVQAPAPIAVTLDGLLVAVPDDAGDFAFDNVPSGRYTLTVEPSFPTLEGVQGRGVDVSDHDVTNLLFDLTPTGRVIGKVVRDDDGMPIAGARVFAAGAAAVAFTQNDGTFALEQVPIGTRTVLAQARGFQPARQEDVRVTPTDIALEDVLLLMHEDGTIDTTVPNELPVIHAFSFAPVDNSAQNPRPIPAHSSARPDLVHAGSTLRLSVDASDPEGKGLTYLWSADKGVLAGSGPSVEWTAPNVEAEVVVVVIDDDGGSNTARQRFVLPARSIRGAAAFGHEIIYSEARDNDDRDIIGFDLDSGVERAVYAAAEEQHAPRVVGEMLMFADQVFTFVQPLVFRVHLLGLGSLNGFSLTFGQTLTPNDGFLIDYRLYTPLTDGKATYFSQVAQLAPRGVGTFDPSSGAYALFGTGAPGPNYPCFVEHQGNGYGLSAMRLYRYSGSTVTPLVDLPGQSCREVQATNGRLAVRTADVFEPLLVVNLANGSFIRIGTEVQSFAMSGDLLAYTDKRGGVTGVYLHDFSTGSDRTVEARGFVDRRVLDLNSQLLLFGESADGVSPYSSDSLLVFRLQP